MSEAADFGQDPELAAMLAVFAALKGLEPDAQTRVLEYVERRLGLTVTPPNRLERRSDAARATDSGASSEPLDDRAEPRPLDVAGEDEDGPLEGISPIARKWMRRNDLSESQLSMLYSLGVDEIDLVARKVPGNSARERLRNVMLLQGISSYLSTGVAKIDNDKLREASRHYDADVGGNFPSYLKSWASEISGSRAEGNLTLTTRGLNAAKDLIKDMAA